MKRFKYFVFLAVLLMVFLWVGGSSLVFGESQGGGGTSSSLESVGSGPETEFSCFYFQYSPCDGQRYEVTGMCTFGARESVSNSGEENAQVQMRFIGDGDGYRMTLLHTQEYDSIENVYSVNNVHLDWDGQGQLPDFEVTSTGSVPMSNSTPSGLSLSTTSAQCAP